MAKEGEKQNGGSGISYIVYTRVKVLAKEGKEEVSEERTVGGELGDSWTGGARRPLGERSPSVCGLLFSLATRDHHENNGHFSFGEAEEVGGVRFDI